MQYADNWNAHALRLTLFCTCCSMSALERPTVACTMIHVSGRVFVLHWLSLALLSLKALCIFCIALPKGLCKEVLVGQF